MDTTTNTPQNTSTSLSPSSSSSKPLFSSSKEVICYLLREFYRLGWCTGSGGGISIKDSDDCLWMAPSGVHKEFVREEELFSVDLAGNITQFPAKTNLKISECTPLFLQAYKLRAAGAVLHSHSVNALLISRLFETEFVCKDLEMIKGLVGHKNSEWCRVPIIENTEFECDLTDSLKNAIIAYPRSHAVIVRNHGVYIWGPTWEKAKIHAECYEYLFRAIVKMHKLGISYEKTQMADAVIRAWLLNEEPVADQKAEGYMQTLKTDLHFKNPQWVSARELDELGVLQWRLDGKEQNETLEKICKERNYKNRDQVKIGRHMENYDELIRKFATEHLHDDEEIRYVLDGSGYFDVRNKDDKWVRIQVTKGVMIILPKGLYHRFVPDVTDYIHVMRLFQDDPKWTPINRY